MRQTQETIVVASRGQGLVEFTADVKGFVEKSAIATGLLTIYCRHTSASLLIQENADPDVMRDMQEFFRRLVPEGAGWMVHEVEGPDDMPAHIKTALTHTSLAVPVAGGKLALGTWQGIFIFEHRARPHRREVVLHLIGD
jgi:secondary thiamine-phosphate synthase enzyme